MVSITCHAATVNGDDSENFGGGTGESRPQWHAVSYGFWRELRGQPIADAQDTELAGWLSAQPGVAIHGYGGFAPEHWTGDVDGHSFSFRERHGQWDIDIDHRPSGRLIQEMAGTEPDGTVTYRTRELQVGEHIAAGTVADASYGATAVDRAQFIVETIRTHLTRQSCSHYLDQLGAIDVLLGAPARWCPNCGARLPER